MRAHLRLADQRAVYRLIKCLSFRYLDPLNPGVHSVTVDAARDAIGWMSTTSASKLAAACGCPEDTVADDIGVFIHAAKDRYRRFLGMPMLF